MPEKIENFIDRWLTTAQKNPAALTKADEFNSYFDDVMNNNKTMSFIGIEFKKINQLVLSLVQELIKNNIVITEINAELDRLQQRQELLSYANLILPPNVDEKKPSASSSQETTEYFHNTMAVTKRTAQEQQDRIAILVKLKSDKTHLLEKINELCAGYANLSCSEKQYNYVLNKLEQYKADHLKILKSHTDHEEHLTDLYKQEHKIGKQYDQVAAEYNKTKNLYSLVRNGSHGVSLETFQASRKKFDEQIKLYDEIFIEIRKYENLISISDHKLIEIEKNIEILTDQIDNAEREREFIHSFTTQLSAFADQECFEAELLLIIIITAQSMKHLNDISSNRLVSNFSSLEVDEQIVIYNNKSPTLKGILSPTTRISTQTPRFTSVFFASPKQIERAAIASPTEIGTPSSTSSVPFSLESPLSLPRTEELHPLPQVESCINSTSSPQL